MKCGHMLKNCQNVFDEFRHQNIFCDAVLKVESDEFPVHKLVLCQASSYFKVMFKHWGTCKDRVYTIKGISPPIMSLVVEWIYTKYATFLNKDTVQDVLMAADMLLLEELVQCCFHYLEKHMCTENCIRIWKLSNVVVSPKTKNLAGQFILMHFEDVVACEEYQQLTVQDLAGFIEDDKLNVKNEEAVYQAILSWTNYDLKQRRDQFSYLLPKVRFSQMSNEFLLNNVLNNELVKENIDCIISLINSMQLRPRLPSAILLAIGGNHPTNAIEGYDYNVDRWFNVTNNQERHRSYHGVVFLNGSVYCVGGFDGLTAYFNRMRRLDLGTGTWHEMSPMYECRKYVSVALLHGYIYAMGGHNGQTRLNTAEIYDPESNQWSMIASMNEQRSDADCTTLNGRIYICGGFNGTQILQTAECYNAETDQWTMIAPMTVSRTGVSVIAYANYIYAVGGFDGNQSLASVETYNVQTDSWQQVASMINSRSNFGIEVMNNRIFAVGGFNGVNDTNTVECYDGDSWREIHGTNIFRSGLNCCVISGLPNMGDYTFDRDALMTSKENEEDEDSDSYNKQ